ncbi:MAG TPA: cardiolipin synthase [Burkholderiales bacterium]|nr:cardiolipin synthase [Burkholderiales bacterium]
MASLGTLYVASEWIIRVVMLFYVPQRRPPASARAWLLLIFFLPWVGLVLYGLIGRVFLPQSRIEMQAKVFEALKALGARGRVGAPPRPPLPPEFAPALDLAEALSEFSVRGGNQFELLPDYDAAIDRLVADVEQAHASVHLLYYIYAPDEVGERVTIALERVAQRGVNVRVVMDAIGSRPGLKRLAPRMRAAGIEVTCALPLRLWGPNKARVDLRNHRKIAVVDGCIAFFGSQNIVSARANRGLTNEEMMVRTTGPIVRDLHSVLLADRYFEVGDIPPEAREAHVVAADDTGGALAHVLPSGPGYNAGTTEDLMIALMSAARERVVLTTPYFIPSESFLLAMELAARRGVAVHLIVDRASNKPLVQFAQQSYYEELLDAGVRVHRYHGNFLHAKHMSVDDAVALIGSSNFDMRSFALNAEVSVLIYDRSVASELARVQAHYLARSEHLTPAAWARRGVTRRALENLARLTDSLL